MKRVLLMLAVALMPAATMAQEDPKTKAKEPEAALAPRDSGQPINVRVDLTITEQTGSTPATVKTISILAADNNSGRIRSYGGTKFGELNVDVRPRVLQGDRLLVGLVVEYRPTGALQTLVTPPGKDGDTERPGLSESLTVILQDGKPLVVSQSADPNSDRKVKLEIRATVMR
jgi:hypothetical protein